MQNHYDADGRYIGETWDGFAGDIIDLMDASDFSGSQDYDSSIDGGKW